VSIALYGKPISELQSVTCHMRSHSVTCHPTQANVCHLNPNQWAEWRNGSLSWPWMLFIYQDSLPICRQSTIQVVTTWPKPNLHHVWLTKSQTSLL